VPRELIRAAGHDRTRSLGWLALAWIEHLVIHGPGDIQGRSLDPEVPDAIPLDDELVEFTVDAYALGEDGRRLYDSAFLSRPKGRDKSGHAARFVLFEAFGPCRFAGWARGGETFEWRDFVYEYQPGEPMGQPVTYPFIRCLATEEDQSGNTYDNVSYNLTHGPLSEGLGARAVGSTVTYLPDGGEIRPSTASDAAKDGGKETFVVFDETHLYTTPGLRSMYATVRRNGAKRRIAQPWTLETSTMYRPGEGSIAEATYDLAKAIREGKTRRSRLLFDHREGHPVEDLSDEDALRAGLIEAYGPFAEVMDIDGIIDKIYDPRNDPSDSRRYFLNQATAASDAWFAAHEWAACADSTKVVADGEAITIGFDGSRHRSRGVTDATALIGCRLSDGHLFEIGVWEQPNGPAGVDWVVPVTEVLAAVAAAFKRWRVVGMYCDPAKWESHIVDWESTYGSRLKVKASRDHPMHWWMTGGRSIYTARALEEFHDAAIAGDLTHDGSFALTRHVLNARRRSVRNAIQIFKETPDSPRKIDAAIAAVLARKARQDAIAAGATSTPSFSLPARIR
jgi:hypothetical protein